MPHLRQPITALDHLRWPSDTTRDQQEFKYPSSDQRLITGRQKVYRIVLHSDDRVQGIATRATFDLGDLKAAFSIPENMDVGKSNYLISLDSFFLSCFNATPGIVEVLADGLPVQSESFDSSTGSTSSLLGVAAGAVNASLNPLQNTITLRCVPSGRITISLRSRDYGAVQTAMESDSTLRWLAVISIIPQSC